MGAGNQGKKRGKREKVGAGKDGGVEKRREKQVHKIGVDYAVADLREGGNG